MSFVCLSVHWWHWGLGVVPLLRRSRVDYYDCGYGVHVVIWHGGWCGYARTHAIHPHAHTTRVHVTACTRTYHVITHATQHSANTNDLRVTQPHRSRTTC
eukprot:scaffold6778_cov129-Isochrysis_galbana.AAC.1